MRDLQLVAPSEFLSSFHQIASTEGREELGITRLRVLETFTGWMTNTILLSQSPTKCSNQTGHFKEIKQEEAEPLLRTSVSGF